LPGKIDEMRIYDYDISESVIQELYDEGASNILPTEEGLVVFYPFNGNAKDVSGNSINATDYGPTLTEDRFGNPNSAYSFDGDDDYIITQNDIDWEHSELNKNMTISVWVYPLSLGYKGIYGPGWALNNRDAHYDGYYWSLGFGSVSTKNQKASFSIHGQQGQPNYESTTILNFENWYHIVVVLKNSENVKIYVNGILENIYDIPFSPSDKLGKLAIGKNGQSDGEFREYLWEGKIDDIRIYNRVLSETEIQSLYIE